MIAYFPELYESELVYSWFARYYAHMYPSYTNALEDLLENRNIRPDVEFVNRLSEDTKKVISKRISMERLILDHTMFPYYRFSGSERLIHALKSLSEGDNAHKLLPVAKSRTVTQIHYLKYCPLCALEERDAYGETYWTRNAVMRNINICVKHKCRLKNTDIKISGKQSPRLYIAEEEICDISYDSVDTEGLEFKFAEYMLDVFHRPIDFRNPVAVGEFLKSRLEGTKYLSVRGMQMQISLLLEELKNFYMGMGGGAICSDDSVEQSPPSCGISQIHHLQHIFSGKKYDFYKICQLAFFLNISPEELTNPKLPQITQTEIYNKKVAQLYAQGLGCHRIARRIGGSPATVKKANEIRNKKFHDYSAARLGKQAMDWDKMDLEMLPKVQKAINQIYAPKDARPKRVTENAVSKLLGLPNKRMDYLPKCKELVRSYFEEYPMYWAREVAWSYQYLVDTIGEDAIYWRNIRDITNLSRENFLASYEYLHLFVDEDTEKRIKALLT